MSESTNRDQRPSRRRDMPSGLWTRCPGCTKMIYKSLVVERGNVCPECDFHFPISSDERIRTLCDPDSFVEFLGDLSPADPLDFVARRSYEERVRETREKTGLTEACIVGRATIGELPVVIGVSDSRFLMGSMGSVVGEKIARSIELAREEGSPFIFVSGSGGGARMDEGMFSLMQMAKTSAAIQRLHEAGGLFVSILTNPTMGGAVASFAALGDVILAEPKALIGFAGPTVIKQTINADLPEGFQSSEFNLEHGFIDRVVDRQEMRGTLIRLLAYFCQEA
ncbi:MAG TPA: acetyl-CoA carboxylase carboxyl transferase subunit beta [Planctomycetes bacterium]|nr:acetyl-CoA carboxylase carboxyl transferase subunit beta [Planctomycetota bacterium]